MPSPTHVINTAATLHRFIRQHWKQEADTLRSKSLEFPTLFEQIASSTLGQSGDASEGESGDAIVKKMRDLFHFGFGQRWSETQVDIFEAFLFTCLPLIYRNTWETHKTRVLAQWDKQAEQYYTLVNLARRNGKTYVTSAFAACCLLCIPSVKIAIFSTCKRTSQMLMSVVIELVSKAFAAGTHVREDDFHEVTRNTDTLIFRGPDGTPRVLGSFPGSVRVSFFRSLSFNLYFFG